MPIRVLDPTLRAGWEADTPTTDSLLRGFLVNWTLSIEAHGAPLGSRVLRRDDLAAVDIGRPSLGAPRFARATEREEGRPRSNHARSTS
jgi:hypothetical protein